MASIYIYRKSAATTNSRNISARLEIDNLEQVSIDMNQPVAPMPLPMEDADENILVKMEGNTETINITWKIPDAGATRIRQRDAGDISGGQVLTDATLGSGISWDGDGTKDNTAGSLVSYLLGNFQGRDINDVYWVVLPDMTPREGWIQKMTFTISGDSPVVWQGNLQFIVGNVIVSYGTDSASAPRNFAVNPVDASGDASGEGGYSAPNTRIRVKWYAPSDSSSTIESYKVFRKGVDDSSFTLIDQDTPANYLDGSYYEFLEPTATALTTGKRYWYYVKAVNAGGDGLKSDEDSATMPAVP